MDVILGLGRFIIDNHAMLAGFILPPFVDWLNREVPDETERFIVTLIACAFLAVLFKWDSLLFGNPEAVAATIGVIFLESQLIFKLYFKDSWLRSKLYKQFTGAEIEERYTPPPDVR